MSHEAFAVMWPTHQRCIRPSRVLNYDRINNKPLFIDNPPYLTPISIS